MTNDNKRDRVNRIKKTIILVIVGLLLFSFVLNIVLLVKVWKLEKEMEKHYSYNIPAHTVMIGLEDSNEFF